MADLLELVPDAATDARDQEAWRETEAEGAAADAGLTAVLNMPSALCDDCVPSTCLGHLKARAAAAHPRAKPAPLGRSPAPAAPKSEESPPFKPPGLKAVKKLRWYRLLLELRRLRGQHDAEQRAAAPPPRPRASEPAYRSAAAAAVAPPPRSSNQASAAAAASRERAKERQKGGGGGGGGGTGGGGAGGRCAGEGGAG